MRSASFVLWSSVLLVAACGDPPPQHVVLKPEAEPVEIMIDPPKEEDYEMVGKIVAVAAGADADDAMLSARNDLRNRAAAARASVVYIDDSRTDHMEFKRLIKVTLNARAFRTKQ